MTPDEKRAAERDYRQELVTDYYTRGGGVAATSGFWRTDVKGPCWVCGRETKWVHLDIDHQHPDCDSYPTGYTFGDGVEVEVHVKVIAGKTVSAEMVWPPVTRVAEDAL